MRTRGSPTTRIRFASAAIVCAFAVGVIGVIKGPWETVAVMVLVIVVQVFSIRGALRERRR
jgi:hypothetical protein